MADAIADRAAAEELVAMLVHTAVWSDNDCTWIGREPRESWSDSAPIYATLGPDLYAGTAGVALALAWAAKALDAKDAARTARGAIRHAIRFAGRLAGPYASGFYSGLPGVAFAGSIVGQLLDDLELDADSRNLIAGGILQSGSPDLVLGSAGALLVRALMPSPDKQAWPEAELSQLNEAALPHGGWRNASVRSSRALTGLSHGASGESYALLEWHGRSGDQPSLQLAIAGLDYEARLLDASVGNWPDFRLLPDMPRVGRRYGSSWCHGAPGIGLVHAYALQLGLSSELVVRAAAATTRGFVKAAVKRAVGGSLCHGLAGNAEILSELAGWVGTDGTAELLDVAADQIRHHIADVDDEDTPALMVGRAGLLYYFLRRLDPSVPSILLPQANLWSAALGHSL